MCWSRGVRDYHIQDKGASLGWNVDPWVRPHVAACRIWSLLMWVSRGGGSRIFWSRSVAGEGERGGL
eukprot:scaffold6014_cov159-Ochromonas_danica.AAC.1